ncbi:MAG TPA: SHOCT domain-containing protein [Mycobacterium sp.]|nr:SHOCT domain-containing protein [Mycobacterium sp.]
MKVGRLATPTLVVASALLLVTSVVGVISALLISTFVLDKYNAYGEVPIPGSSRLHLPAGEVTISFHTRIIGSTSGLGLPVPQLQLTIVSRTGAAQPEVTEDIGGTTTVNNDARVRVWVARVAQEGDYDITTDGQVSAFISPRLAFGHRSSPGRWIWGFAAVFGVGVLGLAVAAVRAAGFKKVVGAEPSDPDPTKAYSPTDEGVRLEQLKTIAALRDSGALTDAEYQAEKRRILDGR